jgi:hypothetical protein
MSGASALAAAKRRRAVPESKPSRGEDPVVSQSQQSPPPTPTNPLNVLIKHDRQITDLESKINNLKLEKPAPMSTEDIGHFKSQYNALVEEIQELKKIIIKVQTFSMEMNIELLNLKRMVKVDAKTEVIEKEKENDIKPAE